MKARLIAIEGDAAACLPAIAAAIAAMRADGERVEVTVAHPSRRVTVADLIAFVASETGFSAAQIGGSSRSAPIVRARDAVTLAAHEVLGRSLSDIGRVLGGRDSSTMNVAHARARNWQSADPAFARLQRRILKRFGEQ